MRKIGRILIFIAIGFFLLSKFTVLLMRKPIKEIAVTTSTNIGLYDEPKNTIDVLYIGSSHAFSSFSPLDIFYKYGITGYVRGSSCQKIWDSYILLKEALEYQKPKVVVYEVMMSYDDTPQGEAFNREVYDTLKPSKIKFSGVKIAISQKPEEDFFSYVFPIIRYHERWKELSESDFTFFQESRHMITKGFLPRISINPVTQMDDTLYSLERDIVSYSDVSLSYFYQIKELCDQNEIALVLVKAPTQYEPFWDGGKYLGTKQLANKMEVPFLDFNLESEGIDIDWNMDALDGGNHINYSGAMKVTNAMGKWLYEHYEWEDKRENPFYSQWMKDYKEYKKEVNTNLLLTTIDFSDYMQLLSETDYLIILSSKEDAMNQVTSEQQEKLKQLGCDLSYRNNNCMLGNIFICNQNQVFLCEQSEQKLQYIFDMAGHQIKLESIPYEQGNSFEVEIDSIPYSKNARGMNVIVYDLENGQLIDSCYFDYNIEGKFQIYR